MIDMKELDKILLETHMEWRTEEHNVSTKRILKYPLNPGGVASIVLDCKCSQILDIQIQHGKTVVWVETQDDMPAVNLRFVAMGTGWEIPTEVIDRMQYIKTVQDVAGFVWHYYLEENPEMRHRIEVQKCDGIKCA